VIASIIGFILGRRYAASGPNAVIENLNSRIKAVGDGDRNRIAFLFGKGRRHRAVRVRVIHRRCANS